MNPERRSDDVIRGLYQEAQNIAEKSGRNIFTRGRPERDVLFEDLPGGVAGSPELTVSNIMKTLSFKSSGLDDLTRASYERGMVIFRLLKKEGLVPKNIKSFRQFLRQNTNAFQFADETIEKVSSPLMKSFNEKYLEVYHGFAKTDPLRVWRSSRKTERSKFGYASLDKYMGQFYAQRSNNTSEGLRMMGDILPLELSSALPGLGGLPGEFATLISKESSSKIKNIGPLIGKALPGFTGATADNMFSASKLLTFLNRFYKIDKKYLTPEIIEELSLPLGKTENIENAIAKFGPKILKKKFAMGGYVPPQTPPPPRKMNFGNIVPGLGNTDRVPALLTPGEFVVRKSVAQANMPLLKALNSDVFPSMSLNTPDVAPTVTSSTSTILNNTPVYNYSISVNVPNTTASPDEIANVVVSRIKRSMDTNIRSNRY
jgi:hypothetical protein